MVQLLVPWLVLVPVVWWWSGPKTYSDVELNTFTCITSCKVACQSGYCFTLSRHRKIKHMHTHAESDTYRYTDIYTNVITEQTPTYTNTHPNTHAQTHKDPIVQTKKSTSTRKAKYNRKSELTNKMNLNLISLIVFIFLFIVRFKKIIIKKKDKKKIECLIQN